MTHRTAFPATLAVACAVLTAVTSGAHASEARVGHDPSPAFVAFRQMERDLVNGVGPHAQYRSNGSPGFGLRDHETN
ncbi:hypothetical protein GCM10023168_09750 [Fodinibacter luteus]|uniref:Uncharacterized protein n=1 Tax=Fodinibacter luteus TaxID=552064 RepID=A0ABP8K513_9MICO